MTRRQLSRRDLIKYGSLALAGTVITAVGCAPNDFSFTGVSGGTSSDDSTGNGNSTNPNCAEVPSETAGPYPADGSNSNSGSVVNVLNNANIYRRDITEGKAGVPLYLTLTVQNTKNSCEPVTNAAVYIWHCDKDGEYSAYSAGNNGNHTGEKFMRGVQVTDSNGQVSFTTIYPGWYAGRITHIHVEVYLNNNLNSSPAKTTQIAFPQSITTAVYSSSQYASHGQNSSVTSFSQDNVFSDGTTYQMASVSGNTTSGYSATLSIGIKA